MTEKENRDEILMIDFLRGRLADEEAERLRRRIEEEPELRKLRDNLVNTFAALDLMPQPEAPADLAERTLAGIASLERTDALIALQQSHRRSFRPTFSLRELAAMIAIMLVAAGIIMPALRLAHHRGLRSLCAAQMGQIGSALQTYAINNDGILPRPQGSSLQWLPSQHQHTSISNSSSLFRLLRGQYLSSPMLLQCPALGGPSFTVEPHMTDFPQASHISYSYDHVLGDNSLSILDKQTAKLAATLVILGDQTPLFIAGRFLPEKLDTPVSENHNRRGQNVLYLDGHVLWATSANVGVDGDNIFLIQGVNNYTGDEVPASTQDTFLLPAYAGN